VFVFNHENTKVRNHERTAKDNESGVVFRDFVLSHFRGEGPLILCNRTKRRLLSRLPTAVLAIAGFFLPVCALGQQFYRGGSEFNAVRQVAVLGGKAYSAVVVEFLHHGEIHADGRNVVVAAQNKKLVPLRILQLGPGDFCRLAFQTSKGQLEYGIFYGGEPPRDQPPPWTCRDGLLLETRQFRQCNFHDRDSVRKAFDQATPIGANYVENVFQGCNPFTLKRGPFLSRYTGSLDLPKAGTHGFITSSQDCSFLSIDDRLVAAAAGHHGPTHWAFRGTRHDVQLAAGEHSFQYDHAAAGPSAAMVAAWEIGPSDPKPSRPVLIPGEVFNSQRIAHVTTGPVSLRTARVAPDFSVKIVSEAPLPDNDVPLIGVRFNSVWPKSLGAQAKIRWDFGDGQTSNLPDVDHVYLRPGLYAVKLTLRLGGKLIEVTNRIEVDCPLAPAQNKQHTLNQYLKLVEEYDPKRLDAASLLQMARAFEARAVALADQAESSAKKAPPAQDEPKRRPGGKRSSPRKGADADEFSSEANRYFALAVAVAQAAFADDSAVKGDADLLALAQLTAPMARYRLGDAPVAGQIWRNAARHIVASEKKAECEIAAADVAINDLVKAAAAKPLLEAAKGHVGGGSGPLAAELHRVWGDYYASVGDGKSARGEYDKAQAAASSAKTFVQRTAWQGAHARSTEEFLKHKQYVRAIEELRAWQREFPAEKLEGYWTLLFARYWSGRGKYAQAIAQAEQLQAVNRDSPYIDQLLYLAADSEISRGRYDRALATLHSLLKDYPGSPLVPAAKKLIETLEEEKRD
jgi:tetratricopeptide (TPR) repeat protein